MDPNNNDPTRPPGNPPESPPETAPQAGTQQHEVRAETTAAPRRRRRWPWVVGGLVALGLVVLTVGAVALVLLLDTGEGGGGGFSSAPIVFDEEYVSGEGSEQIVAVPVEGVIGPADNSVTGGTLTAATPEGMEAALDQAEDSDAAAVILEVNSPGGGVTASDEIHRAITEFKRRTDTPVVVSMGDVAASGGYYISAPADRIIANETTLTGSLGVIFQLLNFTDAANDLGVEQDVIKSGEFKDIGSSFRELRPEEREIFQDLVDESYDQFVGVISSGRDIPEERVREIADGRIYSGRQARELDLIDSFGDLDDAARIARDLAGIDEARVVRYVQIPTFTDTLLSGLAPDPSPAERVIDEANLDLEAKPYYLYLPGS